MWPLRKGIGLAAFLLSCVAIATAQGVERPIIYVHGLCGDGDEWNSIHNNVSVYLKANYAGNNWYQNTSNYRVWYDYSKVNFSYNDNPLEQQNIPSTARFFSVAFYDPRPASEDGNQLDPSHVSDVPTITKGMELAKIVAAVRQITNQQDVIVIAHSLGGIVARVYIEGLAGSVAVDANGNKIWGDARDEVIYDTGTIDYANDIGALITLDTPHHGAVEGDWSASLPFGCFLHRSLNRRELALDPDIVPDIIGIINYEPNRSIFGTVARPLPQNLYIRALSTTTNYPTLLWPFNEVSDGVLNEQTQRITYALSLPEADISANNLIMDLPQHFSIPGVFCSIDFLGIRVDILHLLGCLSLSTTMTTVPLPRLWQLHWLRSLMAQAAIRQQPHLQAPRCT